MYFIKITIFISFIILSNNKTTKEKGDIQVSRGSMQSQPGKTCSFDNCPLFKGVCYEEICICTYGYITYIQENTPQIYCNYAQKSRMTAFFLEFFFPFGAGHLYAGKTVLATIKFF